MVNNFQRIGSESNFHAGRDFEGLAQSYFLARGIKLQKGFPVPIGLNGKKPPRQRKPPGFPRARRRRGCPAAPRPCGGNAAPGQGT